MIIYKTTNLITGLIYIGQHGIGPKREKLNPRYFGSGTHISNSIKFHGRKSFIRETLESFEYTTKEDASHRETYWVKKFDATNPLIGYNIAKEGNACTGGWKHTQATKDKMHQSHMKRDPEEKKLHASNARAMVKIEGMTGKKHTQTAKDKMSDGHKGKPPWSKGKKCPEISEGLRGNTNGKGNKGKKLSETTKEKLRIANLGKKLNKITRKFE